MLRSFSSKLVALAAVGAMVACNEIAVELPTPTSVQVSNGSLSLFVGETGELGAQVLDQNNEVLSGATVLWASDAPTVAQVDADGVVLGRSAGTANITASHGMASASVAVTVQNATTVQIVPSAVQLVATGASQEVAALVLGPNGEAISTSVTWFSLNPAVATIGASGTVEFVAPVSVGTTSIVAQALGAADTVPVQIVADRRTFITTLDILGPSTVTADVNATNPALVQYSALDGDGDEVCGATNALNVRATDPAVIAPIFAANCMINLRPLAAGTSWMVLETNLVADSVRVNVTNTLYTFLLLTTPTAATLMAGDTVSYELIILDEDEIPAPGVWLNFDVTAGALLADRLQTDAGGMVSVDWRLPQFLVLGANQWLSVSGTLPNGAAIGGVVAAITVLPNLADSVDFLLQKTTSQGFVFADTLANGGTAQFMLGDVPRLYAQSYDRYGNARQTNVVFSANNPQLLQDDDVSGTMEITWIFANALGTYSVTATEGAASATVSLVASVGPEAVIRFGGSNQIWTAQPVLNGTNGARDTLVYNGANTALYPTWTLRSDTVAFLWNNPTGGFVDVGLVASNGSQANAPRGILPVVNRANAWWGFPVFNTQSGNPAGALIYASNRDSTKVANNQLTWDIYRFYRNSNFAEKLTTTVAGSNFQYRGLALSPDETKLLYISTEGTNPNGSTRFSQVYEMTLSTRSVRQITNNSNANTDYGFATYSPDGSTIYIEASVSGETQLFAYNGSTYRLLFDDTFIGTLTVPYYQPSFNPQASNVMALVLGGTISFVDVTDPQTVLGTGQTNVSEFSWSRR